MVLKVFILIISLLLLWSPFSIIINQQNKQEDNEKKGEEDIMLIFPDEITDKIPNEILEKLYPNMLMSEFLELFEISDPYRFQTNIPAFSFYYKNVFICFDIIFDFQTKENRIYSCYANYNKEIYSIIKANLSYYTPTD